MIKILSSWCSQYQPSSFPKCHLLRQSAASLWNTAVITLSSFKKLILQLWKTLLAFCLVTGTLVSFFFFFFFYFRYLRPVSILLILTDQSYIVWPSCCNTNNPSLRVLSALLPVKTDVPQGLTKLCPGSRRAFFCRMRCKSAPVLKEEADSSTGCPKKKSKSQSSGEALEGSAAQPHTHTHTHA